LREASIFAMKKIGFGVGAAILGLVLPAAAQQQNIAEKAQLCATCHGEKGIPVDPNIPVIWGQRQGYLYLQLRDFKSGARKNDLMTPVVAGLERDDLMALAEYFSGQHWPDLRQKPASDTDTAVALRANVAVGCTGCHLAQYQGDSTVPRLAGQSHDYLLKSMTDFRTKARGNNPGMSDLMRASPETDLAAMSNYLAGR
jgi:cytochrome c553